MPRQDENVKAVIFLKANWRYAVLALLFLLNLSVAFYYIKVPFELSKDSSTYLDAANFLEGKAVADPVPYNRILAAPLMLISSMAAGSVLGGFYPGMMAVNIIFALLSVYFFYQLVFEIFKNKNISFFAAALFLTNYGLYNWGTTYLVDMGGWFFFILTSCFAARFYNSDRKSDFYLAIFSSSIGVLFKEYGALGMASLAMVIALKEGVVLEKFKKIILAGLLFLIIPLAYHVIIYLTYHYTYFDWYKFNLGTYGPGAKENTYNLSVLVKMLGWLFLAGWPIFLWGAKCAWKLDWKIKKIILALLPASLAFLIWPGFDQRVAFIIVPWLSVIAGYGLFKMNRYLAYGLIIIYVLVNYNIQSLIKIINLPF